MPFHERPVDNAPLRTLALAACLSLACSVAEAADTRSWRDGIATFGAAAADPKRTATPAGDEIDTEHIFGFSMGSDIGAKGEIEFESENVGSFGKRAGTYFGFSALNQLKFTLTDNFRVAPGVIWGANKVSGVPWFDDAQRAAIEGGALEFRYKLLDRHLMPFGLTLHVQPGYNRVDELTGLRVEKYGSEFAALIDHEIIKNKLWAALNLWFDTSSTKELGIHTWHQDSDTSVQLALSYHVLPTIVLGGELRYSRAYEGMGLDRLRGDALYIGPTAYMKIGKSAGLSGTVNFQVAGKAVNDPGYLDLVNYERIQALLRFNVTF